MAGLRSDAGGKVWSMNKGVNFKPANELMFNHNARNNKKSKAKKK